MYVYMAPPTLVGAWSMTLGLQWCMEYYYDDILVGFVIYFIFFFAQYA